MTQEDRELEYIKGALTMPLDGISQLTSMVILHFDIPDKDVDKLVLSCLMRLITQSYQVGVVDTEKKYELIFNPDWVPDVRAIGDEFNEARSHWKEEKDKAVADRDREIGEWLEKELERTCPHTFTSAHTTRKKDCYFCLAEIFEALKSGTWRK